MTCIENYMMKHPNANPDVVMEDFCPCGMGGIDIEKPEGCNNEHQDKVCVACWNREFPGTAQEAPRTAENAIRVMLDPGAKRPTRAHSADAGLDLYSPVDAVVFPRRKGGPKNSVEIDTGVHVAIPAGYVGDVKSKSGLMVNDDIITDGTVDSGYTGSIRVKLFNLGIRPVHIKSGQKIAQLVIKKIITPEPVIVDSLEATERGNGGFGSTGKY